MTLKELRELANKEPTWDSKYSEKLAQHYDDNFFELLRLSTIALAAYDAIVGREHYTLMKKSLNRLEAGVAKCEKCEEVQ